MSAAPISAVCSRLFAHRRKMALWTLQGWTAMFFIAVGLSKLLQPETELPEVFAWTGAVPLAFTRTVGVVEIASGYLLLAQAFPIPRSRLLIGIGAAAAAFLATAMLAVHLVRLEALPAAVNAVLLAASLTILRMHSAKAERQTSALTS